MLITALHTGLRRGEMLALTWQEIDLTLGVIRVLHTKNGERREIPMSHTLRETLQRLPRWARIGCFPVRPQVSG